jgi:hypothetical protein
VEIERPPVRVVMFVEMPLEMLNEYARDTKQYKVSVERFVNENMTRTFPADKFELGEFVTGVLFVAKGKIGEGGRGGTTD